MTHLSDFSFLQRAVGLSYVLFWFIHRIHTTGGFSCLYFSKLKRGELKSIVTILIFVMLPFQLYYDMASCKVKYEEGYVQMLGHIVTKPEFLWTQADRDLITPTEIMPQLVYGIVNILCIVIWVIVILIFHPKKTVVEESSSSNRSHQITRNTAASMATSSQSMMEEEEEEEDYQEHKGLNAYNSRKCRP
ncbi:hypothetical protein MUCCIDRAFT_164461 [Mucor lusitanicus CBS 277.49]|uniref:Uncharacterized protein n=1 Tax=Mucor lusitanicus CBS 277.49 TaxID=747725 RepID=A0A162QJE6_MUCCL|nr:hypothetical protein MUCCIDRAFT_164461 [Mucor lusitanicus CBS 277.49]